MTRRRSRGRLMQAVGFVFYLLAVQALMTAAVGISVFWSARTASDLLLPAISLVLAADLRRGRIPPAETPPLGPELRLRFCGHQHSRLSAGDRNRPLHHGCRGLRQPRRHLPDDAPRGAGGIAGAAFRARARARTGRCSGRPPSNTPAPSCSATRSSTSAQELSGLPRHADARHRPGHRRALALDRGHARRRASRASSAETSRSGRRCASTPARRPST